MYLNHLLQLHWIGTLLFLKMKKQKHIVVLAFYNFIYFVKRNYITKLQSSYTTNPNTKFLHMEKIGIQQLVEECKDKWFSQALTQVNESVVRLGIAEGECHWHKHEADDEFFFVLSGQLYD